MPAARLLLVLLPLLAASLSGCTLGEPAGAPAEDDDAADFPEVGSDAQVRAASAHAVLNATPGHRVTVAVLLDCPTPPAGNVTVRVVGEGLVGEPAPTRLRERCEDVAFAPLDVPENMTPGSRFLAIEVRAAADDALIRRVPDAVRLDVMEAGLSYAPGDRAFVVYTGRILATNETFFTNDPALADVPLARAPEFRTSANPLEVRGRLAIGVPEGLVAALDGMRPGESRTVVVPPEQAYGAEEILRREARDERLPRNFSIPAEEEAMARPTFDQHVRETGQGDPALFSEGDYFFVTQQGNAWRYRIEHIDAQRVEYRLALQLGDKYTLYPFWPRASEVVASDEHGAVLRTTPTTARGEPFTMRAAWPDMTRLFSVNETEIVVRHSPPEGLVYERALQGGGTERVEVRAVNEEEIVLAARNPHPLAGRTLVFDVRLAALEVAPASG